MKFTLRSSGSSNSSGDSSVDDNSGDTTATPINTRASDRGQTFHSDDSGPSVDARNNSVASVPEPRHETPTSQGAMDRIYDAVSRSQNPHRTRALVAAVLSIILVITGVQQLGPPLEQWQNNEAALRVQAQLERLENSVQLLSVDTVKVVQQAKKFLKHHQKVQISSSARTHLIAKAGDQSYAAHARERFESHSYVMKEAIVYQSSQKQRLNETRERLLAMNISLLAPKKQQQEKLLLPTKAQLIQLQKIHKQQKKLDASIVSLVVDTAKEAAVISIVEQEKQQRSEAKFIIDSLRQLEKEKEIEAHSKRQASRNGGAVFFYAFVMCLTGGYLWTAAAERKRRSPQQRERPWSPIPRFMIQIKDLFKSVVVIEDLRNQDTLLFDASDGEDDLGSVMVRAFAPTVLKMASKKAPIPGSNMREL